MEIPPDRAGKPSAQFWYIAGFILFQSKVHAIFPRNTLKILDILIGDLDVGDTLILSHEVLYGLLSAGLHRSLAGFLHLFFFAIGEVFRAKPHKKDLSRIAENVI